MTMTDEQLAELDAASLAAADSYTDFDNFAGILAHAYPDLRAHIEAQAATIARAIAIIEHCDLTEGVCCCGDDMATHAEPMSCGHSPVDQGSYAASQWLEEARAALTGAA